MGRGKEIFFVISSMIELSSVEVGCGYVSSARLG